jgi:hypothetical protein
VIGVAHADTIALLETVYQLTGGNYKATALILTNNNCELIAQLDL